MKFHELKPFILEAVYALFLYIACPLFMLLNGWIEIQIADFVGFILIIIWSACFLKAIAFEIVPGLYAFLDLTLNSFRKERMVYLDGYADRRRLFALHGERKRQKDCQKSTVILRHMNMLSLILFCSNARKEAIICYTFCKPNCRWFIYYSVWKTFKNNHFHHRRAGKRTVFPPLAGD